MNFLKNIFQAILLLILAGVMMISCEQQKLGNFSEDYDYSISELVESDQQYSSFYKIILADSVARGALNAHNPYGNGYTMFLPTNEAVQQFIDSTAAFNTLDDLLNNKEYINALIRFHVVNSEFITQDFPDGVLSDTTASGENISVKYTFGDSMNYYLVQNEAIITTPNIEVRNGVVHVIDRMLTPVVTNSYGTLIQKEGYSLFVKGLEATGLTSRMGVYKYVNGRLARNRYTTFAEPDSMYARYGVRDFDQLKELIYLDDSTRNYSPERIVDTVLTSVENPVYQYFAYHVFEGSYFTSNLEPGFNNDNTTASYILNSFGDDGMSIWANEDVIRINNGSGNYRTEIDGEDTIDITWLEVQYMESNIVSKNGPIHKLDYLLFPFSPQPSTVQFEMTEDPALDNIKDQEIFKQFVLDDINDLSIFKIAGTELMAYRRNSTDELTASASENNVWMIYGNFELTYITPRILAGNYDLKLSFNAYNNLNSTVEVYVDGDRLGSTYDLSSNDDVDSENRYKVFNIGEVTFDNYSSHEITVKALTSGYLFWDYVKFDVN